MNETPSVYAEFGQTLAFAERTLSAVLREHLALRGVEPETWYALKLIALGGPEVASGAVTRDLEGSRGLDAKRVRTLLNQLMVDGLIEGEDALRLTEEGSALFEALRDHVLGATAELLGEFDLNDIETTVRTMKAITRRAQEVESAA